MTSILGDDNAAATTEKNRTKENWKKKSRYENDDSSIHFFYQQGQIWIYWSTKISMVLKVLTNPLKTLQRQFFQQEPNTTNNMVKERTAKKGKKTDSQQMGCKCWFCKMELKQETILIFIQYQRGVWEWRGRTEAKWMQFSGLIVKYTTTLQAWVVTLNSPKEN